MIQLITKQAEILESHGVFLLEKNSDLDLLNFLSFDKKLLDHCKNLIKQGKNTKLTTFTGHKKLQEVTLYFYLDSKIHNIIEYLWQELPQIKSENITLISQSKNKQTLLDSAILSRYKYQDYLSKKITYTTCLLVDKKEFSELDSRIETLKNICFARDLWEMPAADLTPEVFADMVKKTKFKNIKVKILNFKTLEKKWCGLITWVWKWSENKPSMVILERISNKELPTIGLVWKWVTFDTGGLQIKPGDSMHEMKWDMCWAAAVFATMKELDKQELNVNIVACLCLAENTPSSTSYRPSDILTSYVGKTVDIVHTDAEWRLVMGDWVGYISTNYSLDHIMTVATLTGACMVALGYRYAGLMWDDIKMKQKFLKYSQKNFEKYFELPFDTYFKEKVRGSIADLENLNRGVHAWATMGAAFLSHFVMNGEWYTHLDIAGPALNGYEPYGHMNKGMTGFWVDSLSHIIKNY